MRTVAPSRFSLPRRIRRTAAIAMLIAGAFQTDPAMAAVVRTVHWNASPLQGTQGEPLPPATSYEIWITETGRAEALAATVADTAYTLMAEPGVTYILRVRGVSALGLRSPFSAYSEPFQASVTSSTPSMLTAGFGPARPNPFNARTTIAYLVPSDLPATAPLDMQVFDLRGHRVRNFDLDRSPGSHEVNWNGQDDRGRSVPAGVYLARYVCGSFQASVKLTLVA